MNVNEVLEILKSDCIDDPEDLLMWLGSSEGFAVLEYYVAAQLNNAGDMAKLRACFISDNCENYDQDRCLSDNPPCA